MIQNLFSVPTNKFAALYLLSNILFDTILTNDYTGFVPQWMAIVLNMKRR
jgi:hypothetical protein